jgi:hypothetical protein
MALVDFLDVLLHRGLIKIAEERAMHIVLPLLSAVFAVEGRVDTTWRDLHTSNDRGDGVN